MKEKRLIEFLAHFEEEAEAYKVVFSTGERFVCGLSYDPKLGFIMQYPFQIIPVNASGSTTLIAYNGQSSIKEQNLYVESSHIVALSVWSGESVDQWKTMTNQKVIQTPNNPIIV